MKFLRKLPFPASRYAQAGRVSLPFAATLVLGFSLALRVGLALWAELVEGPGIGAGETPAEPAAGTHEPDLGALQSLHLFDAAGAAAASSTPPALNTALNLQLEGVILSGTAANSLAVIASGSERGTYRAGDLLPAGANIRVDSIARDHVVIDNRGQREVLWLFGGDQAPRQGANAPSIAAGAAALTLPPGTDQRVLKTAARLAEIISVTPEQYNGALIGYRLTPGARLKEFMQLGFETNDIVTAVNGIALNDMANLPQLYSLMDGATEVSFSLLRNGMPLHLNVTLSPETGTNSR